MIELAHAPFVKDETIVNEMKLSLLPPKHVLTYFGILIGSSHVHKNTNLSSFYNFLCELLIN